MSNISLRLLVVGAAAGIIGYLAFQNSELSSGMMVLLISAFILFTLSTKMGVWNALGTLLNPFITFFTALMLAFVYFALEGDTFVIAFVKSFAIGFLGIAVSMWIAKYWNMGH